MDRPGATRPNLSAVGGVLLCTSWAPMVVAIPHLPALDSRAAVNAFWDAKDALPRWLRRLAALGAIANIGALAGIVSLEGSLNSRNGVVGRIAAPLGLYLTWILSFSVWWLAQDRTARSNSPSSTAPDRRRE
jgi:hypothetical protein